MQIRSLQRGIEGLRVFRGSGFRGSYGRVYRHVKGVGIGAFKKAFFSEVAFTMKTAAVLGE